MSRDVTCEGRGRVGVAPSWECRSENVESEAGSSLFTSSSHRSARIMATTPRLVVALPNDPSITETFVRAHLERLPANVVTVSGWPPRIGGRPVLSLPTRAAYRIWRIVSGSATDSLTRAYLKVFRDYRPCALLAEYGPMGVTALAAC